jgi:protocatechuate 3,4-dioxygenase beta subunit
MSPSVKNPKNISRRDTLKVCLLPASVLTTHWLVGCADDNASAGNPLTQPMSGQSGGAVGGSNAGATVQATAGASANSSQTNAGAGRNASAGTGSQPSGGAGGSSQANAGRGAQAGTGGSGTQPTSGAGGSAQAGAGGSAQAGAGGSMGSVAGPGVPWATGGTMSMQGNYPDPFAMGPAGMAACTLYPAQTIGPCYAQMPPTRADISDGTLGLPVRLSFLLVRSSGCKPVPDATIDIWHSGSEGIYSAFATGTICNPGSQNVMTKTFCRGVQTTDATGRVDFSTVFPGWYTGRTIHIHFTVRVGGRESVTSQLYFDDALSDEILAQGEYKARGKRDTTNASDGLFKSGGATAAQVLFDTAKRPDGVLHAWKVLSIA